MSIVECFSQSHLVEESLVVQERAGVGALLAGPAWEETPGCECISGRSGVAAPGTVSQ